MVRMTGRRTAAALCAGVLTLAPAAPPMAGAAAPPPGGCVSELPGQEVRPERPWEDKLLDPGRAWHVTRGANVRVGVVDSGVDGDNPHLRGKVFPGYDFVRDVVGARFDCAPHGTPVASIIAGAPLDGTGFHGVAPDVRIVPARITETDEIKGGPAVVAAGIRYAVDEDVDVLNLSLTLFQDAPEVRQAVEYAQDNDVLIVAAAGNFREEGNPTPYPAAYPGVLGVGSIDIAGELAPGSQAGDFVDLVAPGVKVTGCFPGEGHALFEGTSFGAPFVAGTAALVRAAWPRLTAEQVAERLVRTASISRGGATSPEYGVGLVNPYRAVTDIALAVDAKPVEPKPVPGPQADPVAQRREAATRAADHNARDTATTVLTLTAGGLVLAGIVVAGRRRGWAVTRKQ